MMTDKKQATTELKRIVMAGLVQFKKKTILYNIIHKDGIHKIDEVDLKQLTDEIVELGTSFEDFQAIMNGLGYTP